MDVMDIGNRKIGIIIFIIFAVASLSILSVEEKDRSMNETVEGENIEFALDANTSDIGAVNLETSYLSVDDMYELNSPEIELESETCLRFYNYSGTVNMKEKSLDGEANGFATCTLNASIDITVEENVEKMHKVGTRELEDRKSFDFNASNLNVLLPNSDRSINESNEDVRIEGFQGKMYLYPPEGIELFGEGKIWVDGEEL
jgi:hypothetical protein